MMNQEGERRGVSPTCLARGFIHHSSFIVHHFRPLTTTGGGAIFPRMKCAGCQTENENGATVCVSCGRALKPRRRKRDAEEAAPLTPEALAFQARALSLYKVALWGLTPVPGLVLGPLALVWSLWMGGPRFTPEQPGRAMV